MTTEKDNHYREVLSERLLNLASVVINLEKYVCSTYTGKHIFGQVFRLASSTGVNYQEAVAAESKADFIHKLQLVLKEMRETNYWIKLMIKSKLIELKNKDLIFSENESLELIK